MATFQTALITGASSGIGRELARLLVAAGTRVVMVSRRADVLADQTRQWAAENLPGAAIAIAADLRDPAGATTAGEQALARLGEVDLLVNCAGILYTGPVTDMSVAWFQDMMNVNYLAAVAVTKAVLPDMRQRRRGVIVNMSSFAGKVAAPAYSGYGASKFALACFTDALRPEVAPDGIRVIGVYPGPVETPMIRDRAGKGPAYRVKLFPMLSAAGVAAATLTAARRKNGDLYLPASAGLSARLAALFPALTARISRWTLEQL